LTLAIISCNDLWEYGSSPTWATVDFGRGLRFFGLINFVQPGKVNAFPVSLTTTSLVATTTIDRAIQFT
jgi:hypothetical protein